MSTHSQDMKLEGNSVSGSDGAALSLRPELQGQEAYGAPQVHAAAMLNVNETTYPVPEDVVEAITEDIRGSAQALNRYPDREFSVLREKLANFLNQELSSAAPPLEADNIWAANGSNEVMLHILQAFAGPGRSVLSFSPTYSMYPLHARSVNSEYIDCPRSKDFTLDADHVVAAIERHNPDVVILTSPNNPTGTALELEIVEAAYSAVADVDGVLVVDEAYAEFRTTGTPTALELLPSRPRLVISRTMSKAFAFAGGRLGYFAASREFCNAMRLVRLPYHLSALTQAAAVAALNHASSLMANVERIKGQRDRIVDAISALGLQAYPSDANFVFFGGLENQQTTWQALLDAGILVRDVGIPGHLRVTAGNEDETTAFIDALSRHLNDSAAERASAEMTA